MALREKFGANRLFDTHDEDNGLGPLVTAVIIAIVVTIVTSLIGIL